MSRYALALDLIDDPKLISEYEDYHRKVWPSILESIKSADIVQMEIYRIKNRLFMIMETGPKFDFNVKAKADAANTEVQKWEELMWKYQQGLPGAKPGEKWMLMEKIFSLV